MKTARVSVLISLMLLLITAGFAPTTAQSETITDINLSDHPGTMRRMLDALVNAARQGGDDRLVDRTIFDAVGSSGDPLYIAPLLDLGYFARGGVGPLEAALFQALGTLTGQPFANDWQAYFTWAGANNIAVPPGYADFKGQLYSYLDSDFARFFPADGERSAKINMAEIVWGGVAVDGIPALVNAAQITPDQALIEGETVQEFCRQGDCSYPAADEYVFGVTINGDSRAYPLRIMNWHEMFNDVFGMTPVYATPATDSEVVCQFRAGPDFQAIARSGEAFVQIVGRSAGCPADARGWAAVSDVAWKRAEATDHWEVIRELLPDVAAGQEPLPLINAVPGTVRGTPVMLAYCTLCGAGVLYDVTVPDLVVNGISQGKTVLEFGSSGLLMRSNKLMYDRQTDTLWNAITGEAVVGPLAASDLRLTQLPVVVTDWGSWLREHPDTTVLSLFTGYTRNYVNGGAYTDYFNDPDFIMFPVWQQDTSTQENKEIVFALNLNDTPKAYPLDILIDEGVTNDTLAGTEVVIVTRASARREFFEPGGAAVRAYERDGQVFAAGETRNTLVDETGMVWTISEAALTAADGTTLARLPGHLAFWFGWYGFYPETLVYPGAATESSGAADSIPVGLNIGERAPDFATITDTGETVRLADLRGKPVLLNFWATWCGPCRVEMPAFQTQVIESGDEITLLAINNQETPEAVGKFREELRLTFPLLLDEQGVIQETYAIFSYPTTYVLDADGAIIARHFGVLTPAQLEELLAITGNDAQ